MMNASAPLTLQDYWSIVVRRKWLIVGSILLSLVVAATLCKVLPKSYRSNTLILVEGQKIPEAYVKAVIGGSIYERLNMIKQQVISRTLLGGVIEEFQLYQNAIEKEGLETSIENMRDKIKVETIGNAAGRRNSVEAFTISFAHADPMTAMKVTARLASQFIEENLRAREQLVEGASEFLEHELQSAKARLEKQEQAIGQYKTQFMGELPEQMDANLRAMDRLQTELNVAIEAQRTLSGRLGYMEKTISDYHATGVAYAGTGLGQGAQGTRNPLVLRLRDLEGELAELSVEYKESYPDIPRIRQEIEQVKRELAHNDGLQEVEGSSGRLETFDPYLHSMIKQRDELKVDLKAIKGRQQRLTAQIKDYDRRVSMVPSREQELMILLRDYENMQKNYQSLLEKRLNARVAENLERRQKGEQFRIIDPAHVPEGSEKPNRKKIMMLGLFFGCAFGFGLAFAFDQLNPTFRRSEVIEQVLGLHVLAAIPEFSFAYRPSTQRGHRAVSDKAMEVGHTEREPKPPMLKQQQRYLGGAKKKQSPLDMSFVTRWRPNSIVSEQYRVAASQLMLLKAARSSTVVVVSSAVRGEGKTTTVVNLGYTLARDLRKRALLIDCDFKAPALARYAEPHSGFGLVNLLNGKVSFEECLSGFAEVPCWIMSAGSRGQATNDLSKVQQIGTIITDLRARFDYILINTPPILPLADMNVLASMADVLVLVVRAGSTPQHVVQRALNTLRVTTQIHVILNAVEASAIPYYMRYDYQASSIEGQPV